MIINKSLHIPRSEIRFKFARSGGKGGQNVNKVETRVELLFDVSGSPSLSEIQRALILHRLKSRIDSEGILRLIAQESRSQWQNRENAVKRFAELLQKALTPRKKRIPTHTPVTAKYKRLEQKKQRSEIKKLRKIREE